MSFIHSQRKKALKVAERCIECGRCYQYCQFDIFPKEHMKSFYLIRQANSAILFNTPISKRLKHMLFQCAVCDRCYDVCPVGVHRSEGNLYQKLKLPHPMKQSLNFPSWLPAIKNNIAPTFNLSKQSKQEKEWYRSLKSYDNNGILVYHGCYANFQKDTCMKLENILIKAGEKYTSIGGKKFCCGGIDGYRGKNDFRNTYSRLKKVIKEIDPFEIITSCGHCFEVMKRIVFEMDEDIKLKHASDKIEELVKAKKIKLHKMNTSVTIQDSCLMPHLHQDNSSVRKLLKKIVSVKEMDDSKEKSHCCGNISWAYDKKLVENQKEKIKKEFNSTETSHTCTYCSRCYEVFENYDKDMKPIDFVDLIYDSMFDKQKPTKKEYVPKPESKKNKEGLISIEKNNKENTEKEKTEPEGKNTKNIVKNIGSKVKKTKKDIDDNIDKKKKRKQKSKTRASEKKAIPSKDRKTKKTVKRKNTKSTKTKKKKHKK